MTIHVPLGLESADGESGTSERWNLNIDSEGRLTFNANSLSGGKTWMVIDDESGNVGIGTTDPQATLDVNGDIKIKDWSLSVPDYVFDQGYELKSLSELRTYIETHKHLPDIPSAQKVSEAGVHLGEFCMALLKKIEELSLYVLQQDEIIQMQSARLTRLEQSNRG